jgi:type II secretory ATPase GspE/PulE/Tfp pilus assembly ATPase PilB-like protein
MDERVRKLIQAHATAAEIKDAAVTAGMRTLRDDGVQKVLAGMTTTSEVERVTMRPEGDGEIAAAEMGALEEVE